MFRKGPRRACRGAVIGSSRIVSWVVVRRIGGRKSHPGLHRVQAIEPRLAPGLLRGNSGEGSAAQAARSATTASSTGKPSDVTAMRDPTRRAMSPSPRRSLMRRSSSVRPEMAV
jgi:hypothetical protein